MEESTVVRMTRDATEFPDSHHANVPADNVAEFEAMGWHVEEQTEGDEPDDGDLTKPDIIAELVALGVDHKASAKKADLLALLVEAREKAAQSTDPLDFPHEDAGGLTKRELHADLEAKGIEFDPAATSAELFALLNPSE